MADWEGPWTGAILTTVDVPLDYLDLLLMRGENFMLPMPVRRVDERTIQYSEAPATVYLKHLAPGDPWVANVDRSIYRRWTDELGCDPVTVMVMSAPQWSVLDEYLIMHLLDRIDRQFNDEKVTGWDFNVSRLVYPETIDWYWASQVAKGEIDPDSTPPWKKSREQLEAEYQAALAEYNAPRPRRRKWFGRRLRTTERYFTLAADYPIAPSTPIKGAYGVTT